MRCLTKHQGKLVWYIDQHNGFVLGLPVIWRMSLAKKSYINPFPVVTNEGHAQEVQVLFRPPRGPHGPRLGRTGQTLPLSQRRMLLSHFAFHEDNFVSDLGVHRSGKAGVARRVPILRIGSHGAEAPR